MTAFQTTVALMRYRMAHDFWLARRIHAVQRGEPFSDPEPKIEDYREPHHG